MENKNRYLSFRTLENGQPVVAFCSVCEKQFRAEPQPGKGIDDQLIKVREEFEAHVCPE